MNELEIKKKLEALKTERSNIEHVWELVEQFCVPFRGEFFHDETSENSVDWRMRDVYDSTAIMAVQTLASSIHGSLTSPSFQWFDFRFRNDELNTKAEYKKWLQEATRRTYFALQDSNFNLEANECYTDIASFGNSVIVEEMEGDELDGNTNLVFNAIPLKEAYFEEDHKGKICNFYRCLSWTSIKLREKFGEENLPDYVKADLDSERAGIKKYDVIFCIYKRKDAKDVDTSKILSPEARPYGYKYIMAKDCSLLQTGGYYEMPAFIPRWRRNTSSKWGHSPAMASLPDILTLNELVELTLRSLEKVVDPAIMTTERGLLSDLDLASGGLTVVRSKEDVWPFESRARFDVADLQTEKLRSSIRSAFYVDQLELKESPAMTATEVQVRYELMQRLLGPTLGRLESDFLSPMLERTFMMLLRAGKLPDLPEGLQNAELDIQYVGPLTSAQKIDQAAKAERWLQNMGGIAQIDPSVLDIIDIDAIARGLADTLNIDAKYIRSSEKVNAIRKQRQQQQQEMMQLEQAKMAGDAGQSVGKAAQLMGGGENA